MVSAIGIGADVKEGAERSRWALTWTGSSLPTLSRSMNSEKTLDAADLSKVVMQFVQVAEECRQHDSLFVTAVEADR